MLIGGMNNPSESVSHEIQWMAEMGLEFIDLTLEPPCASSWMVKPDAIRAELDRHKMKAVGHTAYYLPLASAFEEIRKASVTELRRCIEMFQRVGVSWMNLHPDRHTPFHPRQFYIERNIQTIRELLDYGRERNVGIMIENLPGDFNSAPQLGELLDPIPELGLHLDIGHANLQVPHNTTHEILAAYGDRLRHVHLHDNKGGHADLHMPLGTGTVDVPAAVASLRRAGYDGTITLEVFTPDRRYFQASRDILRAIWNQQGGSASA